MKKSYVIIVLGCFLLMCMGCTQEEEALLEESSEVSALEEAEMKEGDCATETIKNQLVVKYKRECLRRKREIRAKYNVIKVKRNLIFIIQIKRKTCTFHSLQYKI